MCSAEVKRRISFYYELAPAKDKISNYEVVELTVTALIVVAFALCPFLVVDFTNSLWYQGLILLFQSLSLICLTWALARIQVMIKNHPVFKLSNTAMYSHWVLLALG